MMRVGQTPSVRHVAAVGLLAVLAACGANPEDINTIKEGQREIRAKLADLEKKIDQIASRAAPAAANAPDPNKVYSLPAGDSPFKGPADAPVVLTEFSDFQCPFCSKAETLVDEIVKAYPKDLKFVYKQFPLVTIHQNAMNASKTALAAAKQGKYWEMHAKLFENQRALDADSLKKYAQELGLDAAKLEKDMASPEVQKQIDDEMKLAQASQVNGTPTMFLNGKRVTNRTPEGIKQMIDEALKPKS